MKKSKGASRGANIPSVFRGDKVVYTLFYLWKLLKRGQSYCYTVVVLSFDLDDTLTT
jgi:hypothetical protein